MNKAQCSTAFSGSLGKEERQGWLDPGMYRAVRAYKVAFYGYKHLSVFVNILLKQEN